MHSALGLIVLLAAAYAASAQDPNNCFVVTRGSTSGEKFNLNKIQLSSGIRDWEVKIPQPATCETVNGVVAEVCDYDTTPDAYFEDMLLLHVHRTGKLLYSGTVKVVEYCN